MSSRINPFTGKIDFVGMTRDEIEAYLKLDQTVPQKVVNGAPQFNAGAIVKEDEWLYLDGV